MTIQPVFVADPLDETYQTTPTADTINQAVEAAPQEEKDVHKALAGMFEAREKITLVDELLSSFFGPTKRYGVLLDNLAAVRKLAGKSPEHRAAFFRIASNPNLEDDLQKEVKRIIVDL